MKHWVIWDLEDIANICRKRRENKFDCIIAFTGSRGNGKSTAGYKLGLKLKFNPDKDIIFDREELLEALNDWDRVIDGDEIINSAYKRDFHNIDQIELIKLLNMFRDHKHIIIFCIPNFWDLDKGLRDLVKIRVDMIRRGVGVLHAPLGLNYTNDAWDKAVNEKIERKWARLGGRTKPKYWQLTTFQGFLNFGALRPHEEEKYQRIKNEKRELLRQKKAFLKIDERVADKTTLLYQRTLEYLQKGDLSKDDLIKSAYLNGITYNSFTAELNKRLKESGETKSIAEYLKKIKKDKIEASKPQPKYIQLPEIRFEKEIEQED